MNYDSPDRAIHELLQPGIPGHIVACSEWKKVFNRKSLRFQKLLFTAKCHDKESLIFLGHPEMIKFFFFHMRDVLVDNAVATWYCGHG